MFNSSPSIPLLLLIFLSSIFLSNSIHIEINNIHNGYKMILEGKAGRNHKKLQMNPVQILENTLTEDDKLGFFQFFGHKIELDIGQLVQTYELEEEFAPVISTYWADRREILVTFTFSEQNNIHEQNFENIYNFIKSSTKSPIDEDF